VTLPLGSALPKPSPSQRQGMFWLASVAKREGSQIYECPFISLLTKIVTQITLCRRTQSFRKMDSSGAELESHPLTDSDLF